MVENSYSRVSQLAVASAATGVASSLGLLLTPLAFLSAVGVITGFVALSTIRRYEIGGARLARFGIGASLVFGVATWVAMPLWHFVAFRWEAPNGYLRLDYRKVTRQESLDEYLGENICLKGYALYQRTRNGLSEFVISVDGSDLDSTNAVIVELPAGETWDWTERGIAVSGRLVPAKRPLEAVKTFPKYKLTDSVVRRSLTNVGGRNWGRGFSGQAGAGAPLVTR